MPKIYRRNCNYCRKFYIGTSKYFCSIFCSAKNRVGSKLSEEHKRKIAKSHIGIFPSDATREKISLGRRGFSAWNKGLTKETDNRVEQYGRAVSKANRGKFRGSNNPAWKGGKDFRKKFSYNSTWQSLSKLIRNNENNRCELCNRNARLLHHKNFNSKDDRLKNLILLCDKCHKLLHKKQGDE